MAEHVMHKKSSVIVGIAAILGGTFCGVVALVVIFAGGNIEILVPLAFAYALLGIFLGYFATRK